MRLLFLLFSLMVLWEPLYSQLSKEQQIKFMLEMARSSSKEFYVTHGFEAAVADTLGTKPIPWDLFQDEDSIMKYFTGLEESTQLAFQRTYYGESNYSEDLHIYQGGNRWFEGEKTPTKIKAIIRLNTLHDLNRASIKFQNQEKIENRGSGSFRFQIYSEKGNEIADRLVGDIAVDFYSLDKYEVYCLNDFLQDSIFTIKEKSYKILYWKENKLAIQTLNQQAREIGFDFRFENLNRRGMILGTLESWDNEIAQENVFFSPTQSQGVSFPLAFYLQPDSCKTDDDFNKWFAKLKELTEAQVRSNDKKISPEFEEKVMLYAFNVEIDRLFIYEPIYKFQTQLKLDLNLPVKERK